MLFFTFSSNLYPIDKELNDAYKNKFNDIISSIENDIKVRDSETENNQSIYIKELERINKELTENKTKLAEFESNYKNAYERDWSKDIKLICEEIAKFAKTNKTESHLNKTDKILKYCAEKCYYSLNHTLKNMDWKNKSKRFWEKSFQLDDLKKYKEFEEHFSEFEELYWKILKLSSKVTEESIPKTIKEKFIDPIKNIFKYKSFTAEIEELKTKIKIIKENKAKIVRVSLEKYKLKWEYEDITKDTKNLEKQIE